MAKHGRYIMVGLKSFFSSLVIAFLYWVLLVVIGFIVGLGVGALFNNHPALAYGLLAFVLIAGIYITGYVNNKLWRWT